MKKIACLLTTVALSGPGCSGPAEADQEPTARTGAGVVQGVNDETVTRFRGIPYAAPPVGAQRWRPPQDPAGWDDIRPATKSGPPCAQGPARAEAAEDCLYLDVTAPEDAGNKPVIVWLHGGGFAEGAGFDYDPARMVTRGDVVVVSVEFRLGLYGFLDDNYGFLDQQAALRWVRDNIREFGGDPGTVTLMGESGGAMGTCAQLTAPGARGLIHRAILQSGDCAAEIPKDFIPTGSAPYSFFRPVAETRKAVQSLMGTFDCGDLDCLRARPVAAFAKEYPKFGSATYGVPSLPVAPAEAIRNGAGRPVLAGSNRHEHRLTAGIFARAGWRISAAEYPGLITKAFGRPAPAILREYPIAESAGDGAVAWADVFTDSMACASGQDDLATFQYLFADENAQPFADLPADYPAGASHGSELMHLFDMAGRKPLSSDRYTDAQRDLAATMIDYWTAFARTGDPNHKGARTWPKDGTLQLKPGAIGPVDVHKIHRCDFWRSLD